MRPGLRRGLDLLWQRQAKIARQARTEQRAEAARCASVAAWTAVEDLMPLVSVDSKREALRPAAKRSIPKV